ncbi:MAG TPA: pyridoxamine 5'-phosphate oxidase family protein [Actinomycetospora sp.]|nr:pyridoxamine 5'-phosphate oxidase family protein [Actinomycetospora sp.]
MTSDEETTMDLYRESEALTVAECWRRLASVAVGRVVFTERALPAVHPVNFLVHGRAVIIRTGPGPTLDAARRGDVLAFEADHIDPETRTGWSVLVVGHAAVVGDVDRLVAVLDPQHRPWVHGRGLHVMEVAGQRVTGRRLVLGRTPAA